MQYIEPSLEKYDSRPSSHVYNNSRALHFVQEDGSKVGFITMKEKRQYQTEAKKKNGKKHRGDT